MSKNERKGRQLTTVEIQKVQLDIMEKVHNYCQKENIRYSLAFGTLIGAVRHKGFIPWDDDIDIMMPRPDYDKFMENFNGAYDDLYVQNYENDDSWTFYQGKVYNKNTICKENQSYSKHLFIDVFPCDSLPTQMNEYKDFFKTREKIATKIYRTSRTYKILKTNQLKERIKYVMKRILYPNRQKILNEFHSFLGKYPFMKAINCYVIDYRLIIMPTYLFDDLIDIPFENIKLKIIRDYDIFLRQEYDDYMQLPPEEERIPQHINDVYWLD